MKKYKEYILILCMVPMLMFACDVSAVENLCGRASVALYESDGVELTMCHGSYMEIHRNHHEQWQSCFDAIIYRKDKINGEVSKLIDCQSESGNAFKIKGDNLLLRYFYGTYPDFDYSPLLIETRNIITGEKSYEFEKKFRACARAEIDEAVNRINTIISKPFDGVSYFPGVYGGLYKLRDCAKSEPGMVLSILRNYYDSDSFDGEVLEVLIAITNEVEVIREVTEFRGQ